MPRNAFYPCCARDIEEPLTILAPFADVVWFCDPRKDLPDYGPRYAQRVPGRETIARFLCADAREALETFDQLDVLFYRRDSAGEGGSGVFVLGDSYLPRFLHKLPPQGGTIITDGSNSRGGLFKRMIRPTGLTRYGWHLGPAAEQPLLDEHGLWVVQVVPAEDEGG